MELIDGAELVAVEGEDADPVLLEGLTAEIRLFDPPARAGLGMDPPLECDDSSAATPPRRVVRGGREDRPPGLRDRAVRRGRRPRQGRGERTDRRWRP